MITIAISKSQTERAKELYKFFSIKNSFTKGMSQIYGAIGEIIVAHYFNWKHENTKDYDLIGPRGLKVDVKTKRCSNRPQPHFNCSVPETSLHQGCDYYCFVRIHEEMKLGWILGVCTKSHLMESGVFYRKGQMVDGFEIKESCYNIPINKLVI